MQLSQEFFAGGEAGGGGRFENPAERDIAGATEEIAGVLRTHGLGSGGTVIDVGAGTGLLMPALSRTVGPEGKVLAVDITDKFVTFMRQRAEREGLGNVEVSLCTDKAVGVAADVRANAALICDVYHHFEYPRTFMRSLHAVLADDARVVVIDFHRDPTRMTSHAPQWALDHIRAGREVFQTEIEEAGFRLVALEDLPGLSENYCMVFAKA